MPTYEYRCTKCGHEFELFQRMSDEPVAECSECGEAAERLISSGAGLLFKVEGFYITENRSESYKKKAESEGGTTSDGAKKESSPKKDTSSSSASDTSSGGTSTGGSDAKGAD
ncbi:MAG: zinc ribbon domain-containing protein [Gemmatimonadetes bacterium]|nr:zinc ribbon domain-containing protein [Gemmatimonadota bacterium]